MRRRQGRKVLLLGQTPPNRLLDFGIGDATPFRIWRWLSFFVIYSWCPSHWPVFSRLVARWTDSNPLRPSHMSRWSPVLTILRKCCWIANSLSKGLGWAVARLGRMAGRWLGVQRCRYSMLLHISPITMLPRLVKRVVTTSVILAQDIRHPFWGCPSRVLHMMRRTLALSAAQRSIIRVRMPRGIIRHFGRSQNPRRISTKRSTRCGGFLSRSLLPLDKTPRLLMAKRDPHSASTLSTDE